MGEKEHNGMTVDDETGEVLGEIGNAPDGIHTIHARYMRKINPALYDPSRQYESLELEFGAWQRLPYDEENAEQASKALTQFCKEQVSKKLVPTLKKMSAAGRDNHIVKLSDVQRVFEDLAIDIFHGELDWLEPTEDESEDDFVERFTMKLQSIYFTNML